MSTMTSEVLTGLSVLVLEDEPLWRRHLVASLERWGAEVTAVDSMGGARKALGAANFDFALMDVNLPDGLGPDLLRDKSIPAHTGVVIMTAEGGFPGPSRPSGWALSITSPSRSSPRRWR